MVYVWNAAAVLLLFGLGFYVLRLRKRLNMLHMQLKELIKENDKQTRQANTAKVDEVSFKTDKNLILTEASDSLCQKLGFAKEDLIGKPLLGTLFEANKAEESSLKALSSKIFKTSSIINSDQLLRSKDGRKNLMKCHQRPILNEILECEGISFLCKDISEAKTLQSKLQNLTNRDVLTKALNQNEFFRRLEHDFKRAKRYNEDFAIVVIDIEDLCDFVNKGISFERGDNLLKTIAELAFSQTGNKYAVGRFDKTKFGIIMNKASRSDAENAAKNIFKESKPLIRKLGVDDYNAQMLTVSYTERKGYNDTFDNMIERTKRHIKNAVRRHEYGVISSDNEKSKA